MVAKHEEGMLRHRGFRVRAGIGIGRGNVVLIERLIVHIHLAAVDADAVARHSDHAFDVALRGVARIPENHNIPAFNHKLIHEDPFLIFERGHHARSLNLHRLVEEDDNERRDRQGNDQIADPYANSGSQANGNHRSRLSGRDCTTRGGLCPAN